MIFRSREPKPWAGRLRDSIWPRAGWRRAFVYRVKRLARLSASPHSIAAGAAAGTFAAFSPLFGLHYIIAAVLAYLMDGSLIASAAVTTLANPFTLPLFWAASYKVGSLIVHTSGHFSAHELIEKHSWSMLMPFLEPLMIGSVILGAAFGVVVYFVLRKAITSFRDRRRERMEARTNGNEVQS